LAQNSNTRDDLRVQRTRRLLEDAMIELTVEKGFSSLTVRDITERAMVNRSTFYRHYLDKYDLLTQYMTSLSSLTYTAEDESMWDQSAPVSDDVPAGLVRLLRHVQRFGDFYRVMLGGLGDPVFVQRFRQNTEDRFRYLLSHYEQEDDPKAPPLDLRLSYISCAVIGALMWWLENDRPCSVEQLVRWLGSMSSTSMGLPPWTREN
jgi:AcrR family transcriptional regulator